MSFELEFLRYGFSAWTRRLFVYSDEWVEDLLAGVAEDLGLALVRSPIFRTWAQGTVEGAKVELEVWTLANGTLRFRAKVAGAGAAGFRARGALEQASAATGDALFDAQVAITGVRKRWFREKTRSAVQRAVGDGAGMIAGTASLDGGGVEFLGPGDVGAVVSNLVQAHRRLLADDATAELLAESDGDPVVRLTALRDAAARATPAWLAARAADPDPRVAVAAAAALGPEGVPRLRELLGSAAALDAVRALLPTLEVGKDAAVDAALGRLLQRPDAHRGELFALCGQVGGVGLVAPLLRIVGDHQVAARAAVRGIQGRLLGERGGVSIADVPAAAGGLSAPSGDGRLSGAEIPTGGALAPGRAGPESVSRGSG